MNSSKLLRRLVNLTSSTGKSKCNFSSTTKLLTSQEFPLNSSLETPCVHNRNPRNLEKLRIGDKPMGWSLEKPTHSYWHRVVLEISGRKVTGKIEHHMGRIPVVASSNEWCIKKFLYSTRDTAAVEAVGAVLAQRCLQAGILEVSCFYSKAEREKEKIAAFLSQLEKGGVTLSEPDQYMHHWDMHIERAQEKSYEVHEEFDHKVNLASQIVTAVELKGHKKVYK